jgi:hypothetical protein
VDIIHSIPDADRPFPVYCDGAIVVTEHTSHARASAVKDDYQKKGKPCWYTPQGFSYIKDNFEKFLLLKRGYVYPEDQKSKVGSLEVPKTWVKNPDNKPENTKETKPMATRNTGEPAVREELMDILLKSRAKGMSFVEITENINKLGFVRIDGKPFLVGDLRARHAYHFFGRGPHGGGRTKQPPAIVGEKPAATPRAATLPARKSNALDKDQLIQLVMASELSAEQKVQTVNDIFAGKIASIKRREVVQVDQRLVIESGSILETKDKHVSLSFSKREVLEILEVLSELHAFVTGKEV